MSLARTARLVFAWLALAPLAAADILTVGPAGSGAQFTQIQAAVNAASADDVILVKPGTYQGINVGKPVRILGDGTGTVFLSSSLIRDIGAGKELVFSGVWVQENPFTSSPVLLLRNCSGTVALQDVFINTGAAEIGLRIENCRRAVVLDSFIAAGIFGPVPSGSVSAQDSELWIANTEIIGTDDCCFATRASHGVEVVNCTLHVWRSRIRGGNANSKQGGDPLADGGTGIKAVNSLLDLFGGPTALVSGGRGFDDFWTGESHPGGPGMDLAQNSRARIQQSLPVSGGFDGAGLVQAPAIQVDGTSSFTLDPNVFPTLVSSAQQVQLGSSFDLTLEGNPGSTQVVLLSLRTRPTLTAPRAGEFHLFLLDRGQLSRVTSARLPSGTGTITFQVPSTPALLGSTLFFQAVELFANRLATGNPTLVTITR